MDNFETYLFNRISELRESIENTKTSDNGNGKKEILWSLNNTLEELVDILANYTLNYKIWG